VPSHLFPGELSPCETDGRGEKEGSKLRSMEKPEEASSVPEEQRTQDGDTAPIVDR